MDRFAFYSNVERYKDVNPEEHEKDAIKHYGIMGQKWGQRRWQNPDGTFNQAGKERYFGSGKNEKNPDGVIGNSSNKKNPSKKDPETELYKELETLGPNASLADIEKVIRNSNNAKQMQEDWDKENSDMSDYEIEKMMNQEGWESKSVPKYNERSKEKKIVYFKDIDNDEYEGKKFTIEHDDLSDYGVGNAINDGNKALSFLNKKGSYQKILNEIADNQYDIYKEVMQKEGKKVLPKSDFIKNEELNIKDIGLETYDEYNGGNIFIVFDPGKNSEWFGYTFEVWVDPKTGKYVEMYQS